MNVTKLQFPSTIYNLVLHNHLDLINSCDGDLHKIATIHIKGAVVAKPCLKTAYTINLNNNRLILSTCTEDACNKSKSKH